MSARKGKMLRDPFVRIMMAASKGNGLQLSASDVAALARDNAVERNAWGLWAQSEDWDQDDPDPLPPWGVPI